MPYCTNCGNKMKPTDKFCSKCGHPAGNGGEKEEESGEEVEYPEPLEFD